MDAPEYDKKTHLKEIGELLCQPRNQNLNQIPLFSIQFVTVNAHKFGVCYQILSLKNLFVCGYHGNVTPELRVKKFTMEFYVNAIIQ